MAEFLSNLVARSLGALETIQPRPSSRFERERSSRVEPAVIEVEEFRESHRRTRLPNQRGQPSDSTEQRDTTPLPAESELERERSRYDRGNPPPVDRVQVDPDRQVPETTSEGWQRQDDEREIDQDQITRRGAEIGNREPGPRATYPMRYEHRDWRERDDEHARDDASGERGDGQNDERAAHIPRKYAASEPEFETDFDRPPVDLSESIAERVVHTPQSRSEDVGNRIETRVVQERREGSGDVSIAIGRIEVRAALPAAPEPVKPVPRQRYTPRVSLNDHLRRTRRGRR